MFEGIFGHEKQKKMFENVLMENKLSHAYLFYGPDGIGKKAFAFELAKKILDTDNLSTCVDFKYIERKEDKKDILAEQIRENLTEDVIERPISSNKKVYIIDDAHLLNTTSQNALLKTLEEPPEYIVIILITCIESGLLPTILSRLTKVEFNSLNKDNMLKYIDSQGLKTSDNIVDFSEGSIGKLNKIITNKLEDGLNDVFKLVDVMLNKDIATSLLEHSKIDFNNSIFLDYLEYLLFKNMKYEACLEIKKARNRLKMNGNYDIVIDNMIMKCIDRM